MSIREELAEQNPEALLIDDADDALIGISQRCGQPALACYSYEKLVEIFDAEWVDFNIVGAWLGEHTPNIVFLEDSYDQVT